jgi:adenylate cyclase class 2
VSGGAVEIEVKYRVDDRALPALERALAARGAAMSPPIRQDDQAFAPQGWSYGQSKVGVTFARLRTENGRHVFTIKTPVDNEMACLEHETEIADREEMYRAVVAMGFYPTVRIVKTRRTAALGDIQLCLDEVERAGWFLEIEKIVSESEAGTAAQDELDRFARSLGVTLQRTTDTYDSLVRAAGEPAGVASI